MMTPNHAIAWRTGGGARLVSFSGETVVLRSTEPFAPGSRPEGRLKSATAFRMKTHRCRRDESLADGYIFTLDGRLLDATRDQRCQYTKLCADAAVSAAPASVDTSSEDPTSADPLNSGDA